MRVLAPLISVSYLLSIIWAPFITVAPPVCFQSFGPPSCVFPFLFVFIEAESLHLCCLSSELLLQVSLICGADGKWGPFVFFFDVWLLIKQK